MQNKDQNESLIDDLDLGGSRNGVGAEGDGPGDSKMKLLKELLHNIKENTEALERILLGATVDEAGLERIRQSQATQADKFQTEGEGRIIEGVFDGENMIGPNGKQYSVPANYASKSKLVEGDILKLTITGTGTFIYKQISPIERVRLVGSLVQDMSGGFSVKVDGKSWRVLTASVTYFKGQGGDECVILIPKTGDSKWAAVENVVKRQY